MSQPINHPLPIGTLVQANKPRCQCVGGGFTQVSGKVAKVITNHSGVWYFLDSGTTVKCEWVTRLI